MNIFFEPVITGDEIILDPKESLHCIKVLRCKTGDQVQVIDGKGAYYEAEIINDNYKACRLKITYRKQNFEPLPYGLHLAIAPTKSIDRFEWFVEKATEIGITSITPIICSRSERRSLRIDRLEKVIIAAMKQSVKAYLPKLNTEVKFENWIISQSSGKGYIAHCMEGEKMDIRNIVFSDSTTILIGPEGDFTPEELEMSKRAGFAAISLGKYRLRTETAAIFACSAVALQYGK